MNRTDALIIQINGRQCICQGGNKYKGQKVFIRQLSLPGEKQFARVSSTPFASIKSVGDRTIATGDVESEWVNLEDLSHDPQTTRTHNPTQNR